MLHLPTAHAQPYQQQGATVHTAAQNGLRPRSDIFVRGPGGTLWHRGWEDGVWYPWEDLRVVIDAAPSAVKGNIFGAIQVFYLSRGDIWYVLVQVSPTRPTTISFSENLGSVPGDVMDPDHCGIHGLPPWGFCSSVSFISAPAAVTIDDGTHVEVFALGGDLHHMFHRWFQDDGNWSDWTLLSVANFQGDPTAVAWGGHNVAGFTRSDDNHVYEKIYDGSWHNWQDLGGTVLYSPAAASWGPDRIDLFAIGTDHQMFTKWFTNGQWSGGNGWDGWSPLGGYFVSSPGASSLGSGHLDLEGVGADNQVYHSWWGGQWSPWTGIGVSGSFSYAPAVTDSHQTY